MSDNTEPTGDQVPPRPQPPLGPNGQGHIPGDTPPIDPTGAIPDPDVKGTGSKYASTAAFGAGKAIRVSTPVTLGKSKRVMRANLALACEAIVVDAAKANSVGKDLYLVMGHVAEAGGLEDVSTAYPAILVPLVDRDGAAFLWCIRITNKDGLELQSYTSAASLLPRLVDEWGTLTWIGNGYTLDRPRNPAVCGEPKWPENLLTIDDWIEAAFAGKIIKICDHKVLQDLRNEI